MKKQTLYILIITIVILFSISLYSKDIIIKPNENIQNAVNQAASGDRIVIVNGTYIIKQALQIIKKKNISIVGRGTVRILCDSNEEAVITISKSKSILIRDIRVSHKPPLQRPKGSYICTGSVIDLDECQDITIENCELNGCGTNGVAVYNSKDILVSGCHIHHNSNTAIKLSNVKNVTISHNIIENNASVLKKELKVQELNMLDNFIFQNGK